MKKYLFLVFMFVLTINSYADDFIAPKKSKVEVDSTTNHTYNIEDKIYPIYKGKNGAYYIWKKSKKTNKPYKYYLPMEIQVKIGRKYETK